MWPHDGQAISRKSKYSCASALTSSGTTRPPLAISVGDPRWYAAWRAILSAVPRQRIPESVLDAAHARAAARGAKDWSEADRLRGEIEAAGWKIVDRGTDFALSPAAPPTVEEAGTVRYGSSAAGPSRLEEPATGLATVVLVATDWPADLDRALAALAATSPQGVSVVVVADGPSDEQEATLDAVANRPSVEVVRTSERLGQAAALNAGFRRASAGDVVV